MCVGTCVYGAHEEQEMVPGSLELKFQLAICHECWENLSPLQKQHMLVATELFPVPGSITWFSLFVNKRVGGLDFLSDLKGLSP